MKKEKIIKGVAIAAATVVTIAGGTSTLGATMTFAQNDEQINEIIEIVNEEDITSEETTKIQELDKDENIDDNKDEKDEIASSKDNIEFDNLKEEIIREDGCKLHTINLNGNEVQKFVEEGCNLYVINWNGRDVQIFEGCTSMQDGDITHEEALNKASEYIYHAYNVDVTNSFPYLDLNYEFLDENDEWYGRRIYNIFFKLEENCLGDEYIVRMNAVTGEIISYAYWKAETPSMKEYIENNVIVSGYEVSEFGFSKEDYKQYSEEFETLYMYDIDSVKGEYINIAENYINENTKIGINIVDEWLSCWNLVRTSVTGVRPAIVLTCRTIYGDMINITFDQIDKTIIEYEFMGIVSWAG